MKKCCTKWQCSKLISKSTDCSHTSTPTKEIGKFPLVSIHTVHF